ncbi:hypothetical protein, partial [Microcoleus sp. herbarium12]|uniref:hypothetical protein n=1 Tax=Microcoleus sp. herbarium12 TaxID=3055437 RepID=UPI002FD1F6EF
SSVLFERTFAMRQGFKPLAESATNQLAPTARTNQRTNQSNAIAHPQNSIAHPQKTRSPIHQKTRSRNPRNRVFSEILPYNP